MLEEIIEDFEVSVLDFLKHNLTIVEVNGMCIIWTSYSGKRPWSEMKTITTSSRELQKWPRASQDYTRSQFSVSVMAGAWLEKIMNISKKRNLVLTLLSAALTYAVLILLENSFKWVHWYYNNINNFNN